MQIVVIQVQHETGWVRLFSVVEFMKKPYRRDVYESVGVVNRHPCGDEFVARCFIHRIFSLADQGSLPSNPAVVCSTSHLFGLNCDHDSLRTPS